MILVTVRGDFYFTFTVLHMLTSALFYPRTTIRHKMCLLEALNMLLPLTSHSLKCEIIWQTINTPPTQTASVATFSTVTLLKLHTPAFFFIYIVLAGIMHNYSFLLIIGCFPVLPCVNFDICVHM